MIQTINKKQKKYELGEKSNGEIPIKPNTQPSSILRKLTSRSNLKLISNYTKHIQINEDKDATEKITATNFHFKLFILYIKNKRRDF